MTDKEKPKPPQHPDPPDKAPPQTNGETDPQPTPPPENRIITGAQENGNRRVITEDRPARGQEGN